MPSISSLPDWLVSAFWPTIVFFGAMWSSYLPFSLVFIFALAALLYAVLIAVREDRREIWWIVPPLAIAHIALFVGHLLSGLGFVACIVAELAAIACSYGQPVRTRF